MKQRPRAEWLDRSLVSGPFTALCLTEKDFRRMTKSMPERFASEKFNEVSDDVAGDAVSYHFLNEDGRPGTLVTLAGHEKHSLDAVMGLLVHEAVHAFQNWCYRRGEKCPSSEFEAYSVQAIAQRLFHSFLKQTGRGEARLIARRIPGTSRGTRRTKQ